MSIEFCICTYNRQGYLSRCVSALLPQLDGSSARLAIVDNNSTDETASFAKDLATKYSHIRYSAEIKPGLSHARNSGWKTSTCDWIFYLDDDCLPAENLLLHALHLIRNYPDAHAIGGPIEAVFEETPPEWLPEGFGSFSLPHSTNTFIHTGYIRGGCFLVRKEVLQKLGGFREDLGVEGSSLRYGEEIDLQIRMRREGFRILYSPELRMGHFVRPDKMKLSWILRSAYARRRDKMRIEPVSLFGASFRLIKTIIGRLIWTPLFVLNYITNESYSKNNALYEIIQPLAYRWGEWIGVIQYLRKRRPG